MTTSPSHATTSQPQRQGEGQSHMADSVWIVCADYGYEGLAEPFLAFDAEEHATQYKQAMDQFSGSPRLRIVRATKCNFLMARQIDALPED